MRPSIHRPRALSAGLMVFLAVLAVVLTINAGTYGRWHARSDDGYLRVRAYLSEHTAPGTGIIVVNGTSEFALRDTYRVGPWTTDEQRQEHGVRYLVVPWKEVNQGYTYVSLATVNELRVYAQLVFHYQERTYGDLDMYALPAV